jgi:hypothetical protein
MTNKIQSGRSIKKKKAMKYSKLIIFLIMASSAITARSQGILCDSFCITNIQMDSSAGNVWNITVAMAGSNSDFINYPHISLITDENGDTLATGTLNFFGQIGGTSTIYPVTALVDSLTENFTGTFYFNYDEVICELSFPCLTNGIMNQSADQDFEVQIYPVPASSHATILLNKSGDNIQFRLINSKGQIASTLQNIISKETQINLEGLAGGIYSIQFLKNNAVITSHKLIVSN